MGKDNKKKKSGKSDKKLHISDVMNSILKELNQKKELYIEWDNDEDSFTSLNSYYKYKSDGIVEAMKIIEKYCS